MVRSGDNHSMERAHIGIRSVRRATKLTTTKLSHAETGGAMNGRYFETTVELPTEKASLLARSAENQGEAARSRDAASAHAAA